MAQTPERRPAAVLFAELRNFTRLSEVLQPDTVLGLVNEFFSLAARAIKDNTGKTVIAAGESHGQTDVWLESMSWLVEGVIGSTTS